MNSVFWCCWLGERNLGIQPVKTSTPKPVMTAVNVSGQRTAQNIMCVWTVLVCPMRMLRKRMTGESSIQLANPASSEKWSVKSWRYVCINNISDTHISRGLGGTAGNDLAVDLAQSPLLLLDRTVLMIASEVESVGNGWQPASFWVALRAFSSCCWNDCAPVDFEPFRALRDGCRLRSGSCMGTSS